MVGEESEEKQFKETGVRLEQAVLEGGLQDRFFKSPEGYTKKVDGGFISFDIYQVKGVLFHGGSKVGGVYRSEMQIWAVADSETGRIYRDYDEQRLDFDAQLRDREVLVTLPD